MAPTNDQLLWLSKSPTFKRRIEGFCAAWAHTNIGSATANIASLARTILSNTSGFVTQYAQRFTFSDNVMSVTLNFVVTPNYIEECVECNIDDGNLSSQVNTILSAIAAGN